MKETKPIIKMGKILFATFLIVNLSYFCVQIFGTQKITNADGIVVKKNAVFDFKDLKIERLHYPNKNTGNQNKVILRLIPNDCEECMDSIFNNTLRLSKILGRESVDVIVNGDYSENQYLTLKRLYQFDLNLHQMTENLTSIDDEGNSYYFIFDRNKPTVAHKVFRISNTLDAGHSLMYENWAVQLINLNWTQK